MKKQFKIGECAIGGIIKIEFDDDKIDINALDMFTKQVVRSGTFFRSERNVISSVRQYLEELTTAYHADKIMKWLGEKGNIDIKINYFPNW